VASPSAMPAEERRRLAHGMILFPPSSRYRFTGTVRVVQQGGYPGDCGARTGNLSVTEIGQMPTHSRQRRGAP
jgi:hypothetical protein